MTVPPPPSTCWQRSRQEFALLDREGRVLAASGGGFGDAAVPGSSWVGQPLVAALAEHDGLHLAAGLASAVAAAFDRLQRSLEPEWTEALPSPARDGAEVGYVRGVLTPTLDRRGALHGIVFALETLSGEAAAEEDRSRDLERANGELLRVIAEQLKTEKALQRSQEQLHHAQRLEAIGRLAGGIAHDFNNLLSVVLGYSISIANELPADLPLRADVEEIRKAGERAAELTHQLLAFGRQQVLEPRVLDLNDVVIRVDRMIRRLVGEDVEVVTLPASPLWKVKVDPGQIEQVIVNLVINARDAMPAGGRLTIETGNIEFDATYAHDHHGASPGPHVVLAVTDTGFGMDKETQARIFEPFFTTKEKGKGTGLGLSTVFGIVKQSGGHIWLYSEVGKGTTFKVCFPRTSEDGVIEPTRSSQRPAPRGNETLLLVEDDDQLRALARTILVRHGYAVLDAATPAEALAISQQHGGVIHLLVTDVVMPHMSGRELARKVALVRPSTKVLYMSGYTDNAIVNNGVLDAALSFLQKPLTPDALACKVREVLDQAD